jgi:SHS family lactate transporter-like MFS transporter
VSAEARPVAWWREPTRPQWTSFVAAWAGWVLDGFDFTIFLLAMRDIARDFGVTYVATAGSITLTLLMRLAGGVAAGALADRFGRKLPLMISIVWFAVCDGAVAFAPSFAWVLVLRTLFGFGMGAEWTSGATLAMENWPARSRGIASGILQGSWAIGYILAALAYAAVVPAFGWRALFLVAALPALLVLPIRIWVPESPDWKEAVAARPRTTLADLRGERVVVRIVWASVLWATSFGVYYGLTGLWPALLMGELSRTPGDVARLVIVFNVGMMAGAIACGTAASKVGVLPALAVPLVLLLPVIPLYVGAAPSVLWLGALLAGAFGAGISGVTPLLLTALFPAHVRARSVGVVYHVGALLAAATPTLVAALAADDRMPLSRAVGIVVGGAVAATLAVLFLRPKSALPPGALGPVRAATASPGPSPASPQQH